MNPNIPFIVLILLCLFIFLYIIYNQTYQRSMTTEHLDTSGDSATIRSMSNEAIQQISTILNKEDLTVTNLTVTKDANVKGKIDQLPRGVIAMWSGKTIPTGWAICDGTQGTPNLVDRFIMGSHIAKVGELGGAPTVTLSIANMPAHSHTIGNTASGFYAGFCHKNAPNCDGRKSGGIADRNATFLGSNEAATFQAVTTTRNTDNTGSGQGFSVIPPYYRLCYIMKL